MERDYQLLKTLLSVPTVTYKEDKMISFLENWLTKNKFDFFKDFKNNIYVTKQTTPLEQGQFFPSVVAHMDTVHELDTINIKEELNFNLQKQMKPSLKAYNDEGNPTGIGGDDKCGIFACLELLKELPNIKVAFFVSEETGCHGSKFANEKFFKNVGYSIQFDAPGNRMVSEFLMGTRLFEKVSEFNTKTKKVLDESFVKPEYGSHPYTDVYALKKLFDFSCINIAIGYYNYHTRNEYVVIEDVYNGIETGKKMIQELGYKKYSYVPEPTFSSIFF